MLALLPLCAVFQEHHGPLFWKQPIICEFNQCMLNVAFWFREWFGEPVGFENVMVYHCTCWFWECFGVTVLVCLLVLRMIWCTCWFWEWFGVPVGLENVMVYHCTCWFWECFCVTVLVYLLVWRMIWCTCWFWEDPVVEWEDFALAGQAGGSTFFGVRWTNNFASQPDYDL